MLKQKSRLTKYQTSKAAWYFLHINKKNSQILKNPQIKRSGGWGSIKVKVTINNITWLTSVFPDKEKCYMLPVKVSVRKKENLHDGDMVEFVFEPVFFS